VNFVCPSRILLIIIYCFLFISYLCGNVGGFKSLLAFKLEVDITFVLGKDIGLPVSIRHAVSNGVLELLGIFVCDLRNYLHLHSYAMGTVQQSVQTSHMRSNIRASFSVQGNLFRSTPLNCSWRTGNSSSPPG